MRIAKPTDYSFSVEGIGTFTYGRRTLGDAIKIRARYNAILDGQKTEDSFLDYIATIVAAHEVLCVKAPPGWEDLLSIDALDSEVYEKVAKIAQGGSEAENSFRQKPTETGAPKGP